VAHQNVTAFSPRHSVQGNMKKNSVSAFIIKNHILKQTLRTKGDEKFPKLSLLDAVYMCV
jgi:hypothetical protein